MLWREPSPQVTKEENADAKAFKAPVASKPKLNDQGLRWFSFFNFAPAYNNAMPFYFHTGLIYKGLIPGRHQDQTGVAFALGNYSYDKILADYNAGRTVHQTYEGVLRLIPDVRNIRSARPASPLRWAPESRPESFYCQPSRNRAWTQGTNSAGAKQCGGRGVVILSLWARHTFSEA